MGAEYGNVYVMDDGKAYRVAFHLATGRVMCVTRKTKHGETALNIVGRRAAPVIAAAERLLYPATA